MMSPWVRLSLPIGLGLIAGVLNWTATSAKLRPLVCVGITGSLERGASFREEQLAPVEIRGDLQQLREVAIPWDDRALLYGRQTPRDFSDGDLLLWRDATPLPKEIVAEQGEVLIHVSLGSITMVPDFIRVNQHIGFMVRQERRSGPKDDDLERAALLAHKAELLGPFVVKAIGTRIVDGDQRDQSKGDPRTLTIPVKYLQSLKQLEDKADRLQSALSGHGPETIVGVVLFPDGSPSK